MYSNKLAVAIKTNGRVLREFGDVVYLPFGSEYSIYLKNLNTVRASVKVWIDGTDVTEDVSLVIDGNESIDLQRFIKNGNLNAGNKFKFLKMTDAVADHRGVKAEDGLVRVEFQFERIYKPVYTTPYVGWRQKSGRRISDTPIYGDGILRSSSIGSSSFSSNSLSNSVSTSTKKILSDSVGAVNAFHADVSPVADSAEVSASVGEAGFTAEGGVSDQKFSTVGAFPLEPEKHVIILKLLGETKKAKVKKAVTVKTKIECPNCGKKNEARSKFCSRCGTGLEIAA